MEKQCIENIRIVCATVFLWVIFVFSKSSAEATRDTFAGVPVVVQAPSERWCWAAAAKSLCHYYNKNFTLSLVDVAKVYTTDQNKFPPAAQLPDVLQKIVEPNCPASTSEFKKGVLSIDEVKKLVDEKKPILYVMQWTASGYHCVVICGYKGGYDEPSSSNFQVYAMDPGKTTKQWILYTAKGLNMGQGCIGNFLVTAQSTEIGTQPHNNLNNPHTGIITNTKDAGLLQFYLNGFDCGKVNIALFDIRGACMYRTQKTLTASQSLLSIPFSCGTGKYVVTCETVNTGTSRKAHSSFTILY